MEVTLKNIVKRYGDVFAVKDLNLTIQKGALHFFLGPSGCGKTTTLRMLAGLEKPTQGRIFFDQKDVTTMPAAERGIGMVFQNYALWPHMTVKKNIEYGLKLRQLSANESRKRLSEVMAFTQLEKYSERLPGQLSGGQQQRVALARALAIRPNLLLLDEPLSNLDAKLRLEMRDNISRIHRETGITTVYVTHDQKESLSMGTEVSVMRAGELIQSDTPRRLYHRPNSSFIAGFIGETNLIPGVVKKVSAGKCDVETEFGTLSSANMAEEVVLKEEVELSIRPESIMVRFDSTSVDLPNENRLDLIVQSMTYLGESEQFQLKNKKTPTIMKATVFNTPEHELKEGSLVECAICSGDVLVLKKSTAGNGNL
jgi:ABC-type Fe3+/spermidine/putrescine transport system ATPase subunit